MGLFHKSSSSFSNLFVFIFTIMFPDVIFSSVIWTSEMDVKTTLKKKSTALDKVVLIVQCNSKHYGRQLNIKKDIAFLYSKLNCKKRPFLRKERQLNVKKTLIVNVVWASDERRKKLVRHSLILQ